jgi:hypothetical protein
VHPTAEQIGVRLFPPTPKGFDPLLASNEDLLRHGLPARPEHEADPAGYASWQRIMSRSVSRLIPEFGPVPVGSIASGGLPPFGTSSNWSGSVVAPPVFSDSIAAVTGQWTVADIVDRGNANGAYICAAWVGIDGWAPDGNAASGPVQAGTTQLIDRFSIFQSRQSYAWWEWVPDQPHTITNLPVSAGDIMYCTITVTSSTEVAFHIANFTTGVSVSFAKTAPQDAVLTASCAEWIVETPLGNDGFGPLQMAAYGSVYFDGCAARTQNGTNLTPSGGELITMIDSSNYPLSMPVVIADRVLRVDYIGGEPMY